MYKFDECQSLNSDSSEQNPTKSDNAVGAKLVSCHSGLLKHLLYMKPKQCMLLIAKIAIFKE
jgi:hypothetical protein